MRFLVDGMLGGLAKWLRILGQEVWYDADASDKDLLQIAKENDMVLLTRDRELQRRAVARNVSSTLVLGGSEDERLAQISKTYGIALEARMTTTKCAECGSNLEEKSKSEVSDKVPPTSLKLYDQFWKCTNANCGKVYWIGSHWKKIQQTLERAQKLAGLKS